MQVLNSAPTHHIVINLQQPKEVLTHGWHGQVAQDKLS